MILLRRLAFLLMPASLMLCLAAPRGETQVTNEDSRFMFADTTLLRDTLGLTFEKLFPLADSLRMDPAALKSLSVSYRWTLLRLLKMADSLDVPIDSVGPIMLRELQNPLNVSTTNTTYTYTTNYRLNQNEKDWFNTSEYKISRRGVVVTNTTRVDFARYETSLTKSLTEPRTSTTDVSWLFSPRFSIGGEADLNWYDKVSSSGLSNDRDRTSTYQATMHAKPPNWNGFTSNFNATAGAFTSKKPAEDKGGLTTSTTGQVRYGAGNWLSNDARFSFQSSISDLIGTDPIPDDDVHYPKATAKDNIANVSGTFNLFRSRPVEFTSNYRLSNARVHTAIIAAPDTLLGTGPLTNKQLVRNVTRNLDATLRIQDSPNRSVSLGLNSSLADNATATSLTANNTRDRSGFTTSGRYDFSLLKFDGSFTLGQSVARFPHRDAKGGYREDAHSRALSGHAQWTLIPRVITLDLNGDISLTQSRYARIDSPLTVPVANDVASQSYLAKLGYNRWTRGNTTLSLGVRRDQRVNLPAASTASNSETRSYSAGWDWTYQLLQGLSATQTNRMNADYLAYPFAPSSNRLALNYSTQTTLNAVFNPRFTLILDHSARYQPKGNFRPLYDSDPTEYFTLSDEDLSYSLTATITYKPASAVAFSIKPTYNASDRNTTVNDELAPQRQSRGLSMGATADLNFAVGKSGRMTGHINRNANWDNTTLYSSNGSVLPSSSHLSKWDSNLTLIWNF